MIDVTFSRGKFQEIFENYSDYVHNHGYVKMPYSTWKSINKELQTLTLGDVEVSVGDTQAIITFLKTDLNRTFFFNKDIEGHNNFYDYILNEANIKKRHEIIASIDSLNSNTITIPNVVANFQTTNRNNTCISIDAFQDTNCSNTCISIDDTVTTSRIDELSASVTEMQDFINSLTAAIPQPLDNKEKETKNMNTNLFKNFDFGPCGDTIRMSAYGLAIKNRDGAWVAYNKATGDIMDVDILNFDGKNFFYKMPVAIKDIAMGDVVIHNRKPVIVDGIMDNSLAVVDPYEGEYREIMFAKSPFGFNFVTKVVSLLGDMFQGAAAPNADNPFGNILPLLLLSDENKDIDPMLAIMMMNGNGNMNPILMYALMADKNDNKMKDILPLMFLSGNNPFMVNPPSDVTIVK